MVFLRNTYINTLHKGDNDDDDDDNNNNNKTLNKGKIIHLTLAQKVSRAVT